MRKNKKYELPIHIHTQKLNVNSMRAEVVFWWDCIFFWNLFCTVKSLETTIVSILGAQNFE